MLEILHDVNNAETGILTQLLHKALSVEIDNRNFA